MNKFIKKRQIVIFRSGQNKIKISSFICGYSNSNNLHIHTIFGLFIMIDVD